MLNFNISFTFQLHSDLISKRSLSLSLFVQLLLWTSPGLQIESIQDVFKMLFSGY